MIHVRFPEEFFLHSCSREMSRFFLLKHITVKWKRCIDADFPLSRFQYKVVGYLLRESLLAFIQRITFGVPIVAKNCYWVEADVKKRLTLLCVDIAQYDL